MSITKAHLADAVWQDLRGDVSRAQAASLLDAALDEMKQALARGEKLKISGFGKFETRRKHDRMGRNPQTGEPIPIRGRVVVSFKPSQVLKDLMK